MTTQITTIFIFYKTIHQYKKKTKIPSTPNLKYLHTFNNTSFSTPHTTIIYTYIKTTKTKNKHKNTKNN